MTKGKTTNWFVEFEILNMSGYTLRIPVFVHDAVLWLAVLIEDFTFYHTHDQERKRRRHWICSDNGTFDFDLFLAGSISWSQ